MSPYVWLVALAAAAYGVVAPFLHGYHATVILDNGCCDKATLAADAAALLRALGGGEPAHLVGQDRGAIVSCAVLADFPQPVRSAVAMAVPHPAEVARSMLNPKHVHRSFRLWLLQLAGLAERALMDDDAAFIDYLWACWTRPGHENVANIAGIRACWRSPAC